MKTLPAESRVLEIGCGDSSLLFNISAECEELFLVGMELDKVVLRSSSSNWRVHSIVADGQMLPFKKGHFDLVSAHEVIEHIYNDVRFVFEVKNALKSGGLFILSTPNGLVKTDSKKDNPDHLRHYTPSELIRLMESNGFQVKKILFREHFFYRMVEKALFWGSLSLFTQKRRPSGVFIKGNRQTRVSQILKSFYERFMNPILSALVALEFSLNERKETGADIILIASKVQ